MCEQSSKYRNFSRGTLWAVNYQFSNRFILIRTLQEVHSVQSVNSFIMVISEKKKHSGLSVPPAVSIPNQKCSLLLKFPTISQVAFYPYQLPPNGGTASCMLQKYIYVQWTLAPSAVIRNVVRSVI